MLAYSRTLLDRRYIQTEAASALAKKVITEEEHLRIREAYPCSLHSPNIFVRMGLFLVTVVAVACGAGILFLLMDSHMEAGLIFSGLLTYVGLEYFIYSKKHYRSGVDDALLWMGASFLLLGIDLSINNISSSMESMIVLLLALWGSVRYADALMTLVAYGALLTFVFFISQQMGVAGKTLLPFLLMTVSVGIYLFSTIVYKKEGLRPYHGCFVMLRAAALVSFYLAGNYYVVRELSVSIFSVQASPIALAWLWWILTVITPLFYIYQGLKKKDSIFLWTGLALVAAAVFTIRYYYHVLPAELAMIMSGALLIGLVWGLMRYLRTPKHGFTAEAADDPHLLEKFHSSVS